MNRAKVRAYLLSVDPTLSDAQIESAIDELEQIIVIREEYRRIANPS